MSWLSAFVAVAFLIGDVIVLLVGSLSLPVRVLLLSSAAAWPFVARSVIRDLRSPTPGLRLDRNGIEGTFGRIRWESVVRISISVRWESPGWFKPNVILHLKAQARPAQVGGRWASQWLYRSEIHGDEVRLQLWGRKGRVRRTSRASTKARSTGTSVLSRTGLQVPFPNPMSFSVGGCVRWVAQSRSAAADSIANVVP
jgi:hypothetical protein